MAVNTSSAFALYKMVGLVYAPMLLATFGFSSPASAQADLQKEFEERLNELGNATSSFFRNLGAVFNDTSEPRPPREANSGKPQVDSMPREANAYLRNNPKFTAFSANFATIADEVHAELVKLDPGKIENCKLKKLRFKEICLGLTIGEFSRRYLIANSTTLSLRSSIQAQGGVLHSGHDNDERETMHCFWANPKDGSSGFGRDMEFSGFVYPANFVVVGCKHYENRTRTTIFGASVQLETFFVNGRLYSILARIHPRRNTYKEVIGAYAEQIGNSSSIGETGMLSPPSEKIDFVAQVSRNGKPAEAIWGNEYERGTYLVFNIFSVRTKDVLFDAATAMKKFFEDWERDKIKKDF